MHPQVSFQSCHVQVDDENTGFPIVFHMVSLWFPYGFPMVSLWLNKKQRYLKVSREKKKHGFLEISPESILSLLKFAGLMVTSQVSCPQKMCAQMEAMVFHIHHEW